MLSIILFFCNYDKNYFKHYLNLVLTCNIILFLFKYNLLTKNQKNQSKLDKK